MNIELKQMVKDVISGKMKGEYSREDGIEALRAEFIKVNGGSNKITAKTFRNNPAAFELIEEIVKAIIDQRLLENNALFTTLIDYRNISSGDVNEFVAEGENTLIVSESADGILGVRRQRLDQGGRVTIKTTPHTIRVYDELSRFLSGRVSFEELVEKVTNAFNKQVLADTFKAISSISDSTDGLSTDYVATGAYDEETLANIIDRVEASTGKQAKILGTKAGLRKVTHATPSDEARSDQYNVGFYGKFFGTPMISIQDVLTPAGSFLIGDKIFILATDDKPIKFVREGEALMTEKNYTINSDGTQEYFYSEMYGVGVLLSSRMGVYNIS